MPPATVPANRETWRNWLPAGAPEPATDELLTKDELLDELRHRGVDVIPRTITFWQSQQVLPQPLRRNVNGVSRALFPRAAVEVIAAIPRLQEAGYSLTEIAERLRDAAPKPVSIAAAESGVIGAFETANIQQFTEPTADDMAAVITAARQRFETISGFTVKEISLTITDDTGQTRTYGGQTH